MQAMQELKVMWPHHKVIITMKTHETTWPHHMLIFFNKAQGLLKIKSELFSVLHAPIYKVISSSILKISENLKKLSIILCSFTNWIKSISNTQKKLQPTSLVWFLLAKSLSKCCILHCPFPPYLCICQGVVTSPHTWRYSNDALGGDAASELTLEKKPKRWQLVESLPTCCHLLHLKEKTKRWWWIESLVVIFYTWEKTKKWRQTSQLAIIYYT